MLQLLGQARNGAVQVAGVDSCEEAAELALLPRDVLQTRSETSPDRCACLPNPAQKLGMILQPVLEPVILSLEADQHARRPPVASDQDLLLRCELQVPREIILYLCQSHPARLG